MRADKRRKKWRQEENELHKRIGNIKDKIQSITDEALKKGTCFQMVNLHNIEKQLILYTKGHFGRIDYENDLKYFAAELYGLSPEQVEWYSIINMVIDLYQQLIDGGLISFKLMNFLSETFRRAFREENSNQVDWNTVTRQMLAEIQGMPVLGTGLKLGEVDLSLIK